jgi:hypothetical protein
MASRIEVFDLTIPIGTLISAPITIPLDMDDGVVTRIEMRWPPGPSGLVGLKVRHSKQTVIPYSNNTFIVTDNEIITWPVQNYPTGNMWDVQGYNLDAFVHTIQIRMLLDEITTAPALPQLVTI